MKNPLKLLDGVLLSWCERFSHEVQYRTGLNCFWIARVMILVQTIAGIGKFSLIPANERSFLLMASFTQMFFTLAFVSFTAGIAEKEAARVHTRNGAEKFWGIRMLVFLVLTGGLAPLIRHGMSIDVALSLIQEVSIIGFMYFLSCTPLPPGTKRPVRKKLPKASLVLKPVHN